MRNGVSRVLRNFAVLRRLGRCIPAGQRVQSGQQIAQTVQKETRATPIARPVNTLKDTAEMTPEQIAKLPYRPCVGVMLVNASGQVFVGQRIDNPGPAWQMPQGGIDPGETPRDAALRELGEETGVVPELVEIEAETKGWVPYDLPHDLVPKLWKGRFRGQEQKWVLMRFKGQDQDVNIETKEPEFSRWKWLGADQLIDNIVPFKRDVYRAVLNEFEDLL